jgi:hypothetical protein
MFARPFFVLFLLYLATGVAWSQSLAGRYSNRELKLELRETGAGAYTGTLVLEGQSYPLSAQGTAAQLKGEFSAGGTRFPFAARVDGTRMTLNSAGVDHVLNREAVPAAATGAGAVFRHSKGYSLRLASGWTATENPDGIILLPAGANFEAGRSDNAEVYIAMVRDGYSPAEEAKLVGELSAAFTQGAGSVQRNGVREAMNFGPRPGAAYRWDIRDPKLGRNVAFDIFGAPEGGRYFAMISVGTAERVRPRESEVRQMMASLAFEAPKPLAAGPLVAGGPLADTTPLAQQWLQKLKGRMIRQMYAYSGMSSDKYHYINADGSYVYRSSSMVSVDVSGASGMSSGGSASRGRWKIRDVGGQVFLEVRYENGESRMMPITQDARNWFLNGEKAFAVDPQ